MRFVVETYRPGKGGVKYRVWREGEFSCDHLSPSMTTTAVFAVEASGTTEAVALVLERAAGIPTAVSLTFGGSTPYEEEG